MLSPDFAANVDDQIEESRKVLYAKSKAYNTDDRLSAFKVAGALQGITPQAALAGMMSKHTGSIYQMCHSENTYTMDEWTEKITDHINYLLNLKAIVVEQDKQSPTESYVFSMPKTGPTSPSPFPNSIPCNSQ
jgi:hypothetical protein